MIPLEPLTPLQFTPIFKAALWGGTRLRPMLGAAPAAEATGEAWLLSDYGADASVVANGPFAGTTLRQLMLEAPERLLGRPAEASGRFPLLLKIIDARRPLSVQVHPTDAQARVHEPDGPGRGKTEAWVVLEADADARVYAGLEPGVTPDLLRRSIARGDVEQFLYAHSPQPGDTFFLKAGTVHAIGGGLVIFEVQQTSDITYRLYDWGRLDPATGQPRELHIEKGLACVDYTIGPCRPVVPTDEIRGRVKLTPLVECEYFTLGRWDGDRPFQAGAAGKCRVLVGNHGRAMLQHAGIDYPVGPGDVWLLPAEVGACQCVPDGPTTLLECGLPE